MRISNLIKVLQHAKEHKGDVNVHIGTEENNNLFGGVKFGKTPIYNGKNFDYYDILILLTE